MIVLCSCLHRGCLRFRVVTGVVGPITNGSALSLAVAELQLLTGSVEFGAETLHLV